MSSCQEINRKLSECIYLISTKERQFQGFLRFASVSQYGALWKIHDSLKAHREEFMLGPIIICP